ncbi:unnamed protein product [Cuscuta campestris]|uniref:Uncharacterized protein n=1 Tax=Cuscuta campestris TaxID=132261 RepID=A0A484LE05_9ASTE|nr:unnamed protein product [Cuscuta campestris]
MIQSVVSEQPSAPPIAVRNRRSPSSSLPLLRACAADQARERESAGILIQSESCILGLIEVASYCLNSEALKWDDGCWSSYGSAKNVTRSWTTFVDD